MKNNKLSKIISLIFIFSFLILSVTYAVSNECKYRVTWYGVTKISSHSPVGGKSQTIYISGNEWNTTYYSSFSSNSYTNPNTSSGFSVESLGLSETELATVKYIQFKIEVSDESGTETNTSNNVGYSNVKFKYTAPEVAITQDLTVDLSNAKVYDGGTVVSKDSLSPSKVYNLKVVNFKATEALSLPVQYSYSNNGGTASVMNTTFTGGTESNPTHSTEFDIIPFTTPSTPGTYSISITIDSSNQVAESNETNNTATFTYTVGTPVVGQDLTVDLSNAKVYDGSTQADKNKLVPSKVYNLKVVNFKATETLSRPVQYSYSNNGGTASVMNTTFTGGTESNPTHSTEFDIIPFETPSTPGTYSVLITIDSDNQVAESNDTNNSATFTYTVEAPVTQDLTVDLSNAKVYDGATQADKNKLLPSTLYNLKVINFKATEALSLPVQYSYSNNGGTASFMNTTFTGGTESNPTHSTEFDIIPFTTPSTPGTYSISITIDSSNQVAESNETNNTATFTYTVVPPFEFDIYPKNTTGTLDVTNASGGAITEISAEEQQTIKVVSNIYTWNGNLSELSGKNWRYSLTMRGRDKDRNETFSGVELASNSSVAYSSYTGATANSDSGIRASYGITSTFDMYNLSIPYSNLKYTKEVGITLTVTDVDGGEKAVRQSNNTYTKWFTLRQLQIDVFPNDGRSTEPDNFITNLIKASDATEVDKIENNITYYLANILIKYIEELV